MNSWKSNIIANENLEIKYYIDYKEVKGIVSPGDTEMTLVRSNKSFLSIVKENSDLWKHFVVI